MTCLFRYCFHWPQVEARFFRRSLEELPEFLGQEPTSLHLSVEPVPRSLQRKLDPVLAGEQPWDYFARLNRAVSESCTAGKLVIYCRPDTPLVCETHAADPMAARGASRGRVALVWVEGNKHLIWHEALHTLGAEDCYHHATGQPSCELNGCIMQRAPSAATVRRWPFLCPGNVRRVVAHHG